jgi:hypothetical protein
MMTKLARMAEVTAAAAAAATDDDDNGDCSLFIERLFYACHASNKEY